MLTLIYNAMLIMENGIQYGYVVIQNEKIVKVGTAEPDWNISYDKTVDLHGDFLSPGFVEIHTHGAGGADFADGTADTFVTACQVHLQHGTTTILPTVSAVSKENLIRSIDAFREAQVVLKEKGPNLHGIHFEGPYLNVEMCGGIDPEFIRLPDPEEYEYILDYGRGAIARWTLAVELPGSERFVKRLVEEQILPSLGHSTAIYDQVKSAFDWGVTHVTHLYSAMSTITRKSGFRYSGVLESAYCIPEMTVEIIADGCHLPTELLELVYRVKGVEKTALTCDSIHFAGQEANEASVISEIRGRYFIIEDGVAKMPDRSCFAGSIATDDRLIRVMHQKVGIPLCDAVNMMTLTPARIAKIDNTKGSIAEGKDADLICFDDQVKVKGTMVLGKGTSGNLI